MELQGHPRAWWAEEYDTLERKYRRAQQDYRSLDYRCSRLTRKLEDQRAATDMALITGLIGWFLALAFVIADWKSIADWFWSCL